MSNQYMATYDYEHTPGYQAIQLIKTLTLLMSTEKLAAIAWYRIEDLPSTQDVIGDVNNRHLGVVTTEFKSKPAEAAITFSHHLFSERIKYLGDKVAVQKWKGSESEVYCFENEHGSVLVIGWLKTHVTDKPREDKEGMLKDARLEKVSLVIPKALGGKALQYNELGEEKPFAGAQVKANKTLVNDLPLRGGEIVILKLAK